MCVLMVKIEKCQWKIKNVQIYAIKNYEQILTLYQTKRLIVLKLLTNNNHIPGKKVSCDDCEVKSSKW